MARLNIILPAMGEGVIEATINKWLVKEGAEVKEDDPIAEVATDKVDSEIPAPTTGIIIELKATEGSVVKVGDAIAVIENKVEMRPEEVKKVDQEVERIRETISAAREEKKEVIQVSGEMKSRTPSGKFLSPLVRNIASHEGISYSELDKVTGTGMDGRITRDDILKLLSDRKNKSSEPEKKIDKVVLSSASQEDEV
ncbi:MAG TPA: hypothetical protein DEO60_14805, partial [Bacteroidales bacterium]|nr:hypothetical protein [Bacteroidales bacterium]HBZ22398.1 hypothetical protein [Bacteroidales bacterium]